MNHRPSGHEPENGVISSPFCRKCSRRRDSSIFFATAVTRPARCAQGWGGRVAQQRRPGGCHRSQPRHCRCHLPLGNRSLVGEPGSRSRMRTPSSLRATNHTCDVPSPAPPTPRPARLLPTHPAAVERGTSSSGKGSGLPVARIRRPEPKARCLLVGSTKRGEVSHCDKMPQSTSLPS